MIERPHKDNRSKPYVFCTPTVTFPNLNLNFLNGLSATRNPLVHQFNFALLQRPVQAPDFSFFVFFYLRKGLKCRAELLLGLFLPVIYPVCSLV